MIPFTPAVAAIIAVVILGVSRWFSLMAHAYHRRDSALGFLCYFFVPLFASAFAVTCHSNETERDYGLAAVFGLTALLGVHLGARRWRTMSDAKKEELSRDLDSK